ncbi:hypothetical protein [Tateyamaria sp.]|uniref:hypothetical protein n=1 Tax=Tateyamaria sp. TaxID=1929288 RepID=UPI00329AF4FB
MVEITFGVNSKVTGSSNNENGHLVGYLGFNRKLGMASEPSRFQISRLTTLGSPQKMTNRNGISK